MVGAIDGSPGDPAEKDEDEEGEDFEALAHGSCSRSDDIEKINL
jgi:hypothetical protein